MKLEESLSLFKCLSDKSRLMIVSMLAKEDLYTELIAEKLSLSPSTVSFHLKKLEESKLVSSKKDQYYTIYSLNKKMLSKRLLDIVGENKDEDELQRLREEKYKEKVLESFFEYGRLKQMPAQRKKQIICLEQMAKAIAFGKVYEEKELNEVLLHFNEDYCSIRRYMIAEGILKREGSNYTRIR